MAIFRNPLAKKSITSLAGPVEFINESINASHAEESPKTAPCTLSVMVFAIVVKSPSTLVTASRRVFIFSASERKALNAATLRLSVSSNVEARSIPLSLNFTNPSTISGSVFTLPPNSLANFPLASAKFNMIFLVAVADIEASNPASANFPSKAKVSSMVKLKALATGPTIGIAV